MSAAYADVPAVPAGFVQIRKAAARRPGKRRQARSLQRHIAHACIPGDLQ
jgi:hypothetical protein